MCEKYTNVIDYDYVLRNKVRLFKQKKCNM